MKWDDNLKLATQQKYIVFKKTNVCDTVSGIRIKDYVLAYFKLS